MENAFKSGRFEILAESEGGDEAQRDRIIWDCEQGDIVNFAHGFVKTLQFAIQFLEFRFK